MMKRLLCSLLLLPMFALSGESPGEAIQLALKNSSALKAASGQIQAAELEEKSVKRSFLPSVGVGASYLYNSADAEITLPGIGSVSLIQHNTIDFSGTVTWPVFTGFARETNLQMHRIAVQISENGLLSRQIQTALETLVYYRQVQSAQLQIHSLESGRDRLNLQLKQLQDLSRQGMASESDLISLKLSLLDYEQQIVSANSDLDKARAGLKEKTGKDIEVSNAPESLEGINLPKFDPSGIPALAAYSLQKDQALAQAKMEKASLYPDLALNSSFHYGLPGADSVANDWMFYFTAGAKLSWSTDWGASSAKSEAAEKRGDAADSSYDEALSRTNLQFRQDSDKINSMISQLDVLKQASELTARKSDIVENQYKQGMATVTDYTDAALAQTVADLRYKTQILLILLKVNQLEAMSGTPMENWSVSK